MKNHLLLLAAVITSTLAIAQTDTSIVYYKEGRLTTKDSAVTYVRYYQQGNVWHGIGYYAKNNVLKSEGNYADKSLSKPVGSFKNFNEKGELDFTAEYNNGEVLEKTWYYKNGSKKSWIAYSDLKTQQKGWDEAGKEIKNYVVEREAIFKGGLPGWKSFLEKNLNAMVAADAGAPVGSYGVTVQFVINKEGYVTNVKPVKIPDGCKPCAQEVVRLLVSSPKWEHAIQNNVPVTYQAIQNITFQVAEDAKKKKKFW